MNIQQNNRLQWNPDIPGIPVLNRDQLHHPMYPSDTFMKLEAITILAQTIVLPGSMIQNGTFFMANALTRRATEAYTQPYTNRLTTLLSRLPRDGISRIIASTAMIAGVSLAAYALYSLSTYSLISGAIFSIHSLFMRDLSCAPQRAAKQGLISLQSLLETDRTNFILKERTRAWNESRSENIASVAFLVTSVGLTVLWGNPIIANAIGYPAAALIKSVALHILTENAIHRQDLV